MLVLPLFKNLVRPFGNCRKNDLLMAFFATLNGNHRNSWTLSDTILHLNISLQVSQKPLELLQVSRSSIGNGTELQISFAPIHPLIALPRTATRRTVRFAGVPNEDIEELLVATINERGNGSTLNDIHASALQRETVISEIANRKNEFDLALKPALYGSRIGGTHVC